MKIEIWVATDKIRSKVTRTIDVESDDWTDMSEMEKDQYVWEEIQNKCMIEWGYKAL